MAKKLSPAQQHVIQLLCEGKRLIWMEGIRPSAHYQDCNDSVSIQTVAILRQRGFIAPEGGEESFPATTYVLTSKVFDA